MPSDEQPKPESGPADDAPEQPVKDTPTNADADEPTEDRGTAVAETPSGAKRATRMRLPADEKREHD